MFWATSVLVLTCNCVTGVLHGSVVKCLTRNSGVLGSSPTGFSEFFVGVSLGKTLPSPSLVLVKPRKNMNNVSCGRDMTEILLKAGKELKIAEMAEFVLECTSNDRIRLPKGKKCGI